MQFPFLNGALIFYRAIGHFAILDGKHTQNVKKILYVMNINFAYPYHCMGLILYVFQNKCIIDIVFFSLNINLFILIGG